MPALRAEKYGLKSRFQGLKSGFDDDIFRRLRMRPSKEIRKWHNPCHVAFVRSISTHRFGNMLNKLGLIFRRCGTVVAGGSHPLSHHTELLAHSQIIARIRGICCHAFGNGKRLAGLFGEFDISGGIRRPIAYIAVVPTGISMYIEYLPRRTVAEARVADNRPGGVKQSRIIINFSQILLPRAVW